MSESYQALATLGAYDQLEPDVVHVFSAIDLTNRSGEDVEISSLWTTRPVHISFECGATPLTAGEMSQEKALELADIELARYELADEYLNQRELAIRGAIRITMPELQHGITRESIADTFRKLGGVAVLEGTLLGVSTAAGYYQDLRLLGRWV